MDIPTLLCQFRAVFGEPGNQFSLLRTASSISGRAKKPNSTVQPSTFDMLAGASPASASMNWCRNKGFLQPSSGQLRWQSRRSRLRLPLFGP